MILTAERSESHANRYCFSFLGEYVSISYDKTCYTRQVPSPSYTNNSCCRQRKMEKVYIIYIFCSVLLLLHCKRPPTLAFTAYNAALRTNKFWIGRCNFISEEQCDYVSEGQVNNCFDVPSLNIMIRDEIKTNNKTFHAEEQRRNKGCSLHTTATTSSLLMLPVITFFPSTSEAVDILSGLYISELITKFWLPISTLVSNQEHLLVSALTEASRFMMDLSSFVTTEKIILRLAGIISRLVNIEIDVSVSSNHGTPSPVEEIIFQAAMLGISISLLSRTAFPLLLSSDLVDTLSFQDLVLYKSLFRPVGVSLLQFRTLLSMKVLEWVDLGPNVTLPTGSSDSSTVDESVDQYIYWLYNGDTKIILQWSNSVVHYRLKRRRGKPILQPNNTGENSSESSPGNRKSFIDLNDIVLIADMNFVEMLEERRRSAVETAIPKRKRRTDEDNDNDETWCPKPLIQSGSTGAQLLRIDGKKLLGLMDDDDKLDSSIRALLLQCSGSNLVTVLQLREETA